MDAVGDQIVPSANFYVMQVSVIARKSQIKSQKEKC